MAQEKKKLDEGVAETVDFAVKEVMGKATKLLDESTGFTYRMMVQRAFGDETLKRLGYEGFNYGNDPEQAALNKWTTAVKNALGTPELLQEIATAQTATLTWEANTATSDEKLALVLQSQDPNPRALVQVAASGALAQVPAPGAVAKPGGGNRKRIQTSAPALLGVSPSAIILPPPPEERKLTRLDALQRQLRQLQQQEGQALEPFRESAAAVQQQSQAGTGGPTEEEEDEAELEAVKAAIRKRQEQ
jgi:hypothetical protein